MKIENLMFHNSWLSYQAFCIPCSYFKVITCMQAETKKVTFITDEVFTRFMTSLELYP